MSRIKVAVLRGGTSPAYEESLKTGGYVLSLLRSMPEEYEPFDVFISKDGEWHQAGVSADPYVILSKADVVWNALHGGFGESGEVQRFLESLQLPYTGSGTASALFAHDKELAKTLYVRHNIPTPAFASVRNSDDWEEKLVAIFRNQPHPFVVKPATGVAGIGVRLARTFQELKEAVRRNFAHAPKVLVEEFVSGTIASAHVIEDAKGERFYALVPTHLETYYRRVRPRPEENRQMEEYAKLAHEALGLKHYSSSDFVVTPKGKIYILETNAQPVFHEDSLFHQSLEGSGWKPKDFVAHSIKLALEK